MTALDTASILRKLMDAFPDKRVERATLEVYLQHLDDIPPRLLEQAVEAHIKSSQWFPRVAELRQAAERIANTRHFETLAPQPGDPLAAKALALEDRFFAGGGLEPSAWEQLAAAFERAERPHRAEYAREKLRRLGIIAGSGGAEAQRM